MPPNEVEVKLIFTRRRSAKVMGKLAEVPASLIDYDDTNKAEDDFEENDEAAKASAATAATGDTKHVMEPREGDPVRGILVTQQNSSKIVSPEDLSTYTPLRVGMVSSRLHVPFVGKRETLRMFLREMFRGVEEERWEKEDRVNSGGETNSEGNKKEEGGNVEGGDEEGLVVFSLHGGQVSG